MKNPGVVIAFKEIVKLIIGGHLVEFLGSCNNQNMNSSNNQISI
jgi:hypothetical protein